VDASAVDGPAFVTALKQAIAGGLSSVTEDEVYITAVKEGSLVVDYTVVADSEEEAVSLSASIVLRGADLFSSMEAEHGGAVVSGVPEVAEPKDDGVPIAIIIGAVAGVVVVLIIVIVVVVVYMRKRSAVRNNPTGAVSSTQPGAANRVEVNPKDTDRA
jgi:amino acid transporter